MPAPEGGVAGSGDHATEFGGPAEFDAARGAFDGVSYLYQHDDVRHLLGHDPDGAARHWRFRGRHEDRAPVGLPRARPRRCDSARFRERPFGLTLWGPFEAVSGLGTAARNFRDAVRRSGLPHACRSYDVESGHARLHDAADADAASPYRVNLVLANADQIRRVVSLHRADMLDDAYTIAIWAWELGAFPTRWHASFALVDEVWTNSRFERDAIAAAAPVPVHLMPIPVGGCVADPETRRRARRRFDLPADGFVVLCPFDPGSTEARKNPFGAMRAFRAAFGNDPARVLVVKYHGGGSALAARLAAARGGHGNIRLLGARLDDAEHAALGDAADAVLSAHRAEGFGLNVAEALASGRDAIATDWSGVRDFLDAGTGWKVRAALRTVGAAAGPYGPDAVWAEPDHADLVRALRHAASDAGDRTARRNAAAARMASSFGADAIGARIRARLSALGLDRDDPPPDGVIARSADASLDRIVPAPASAAETAAIRWPERLPLFSVAVPDDASPLLLERLRAQSYPFWEALLVRRDLPPAEDVASRRARRGDDPRVRLVAMSDDPRPGDPGRDDYPGEHDILAASAGPFVVRVDDPDALDPDALMDAARALDAASPPTRFARRGLLVTNKDALLAARSGSVRVRTTRADVVVSVVGRDAAALRARAGPTTARLDWRLGDWSGNGDGDAPSLAAAILRTDAAEHLVVVGPGATAPERPDWPDRLLAVPRDGAVGGVVPWIAGAPFDPDRAAALLLATTRAVLRRVASLGTAGDGGNATPTGPGWAASFRRLGLALVPADGIAIPVDPVPSVPDEATHRRLAAASGLFDAAFYGASAADVASTGGDPLRHYVAHGWREGRAPNFYLDPAEYRARAGLADPPTIDPVLHWIAYRRSGVRPSIAFDPAFVRWERGLAVDADPLADYLAARRTADRNPVPGFDAAHYRRLRPDLAYRDADPFEHYVRHGVREGVNPSPGFDTTYYVARHMPFGARPGTANGNPLLHWLATGAREPVATSWRDAVRARVAALRTANRRAIGLGFGWCDGLPQEADALRAFLLDRSIDFPLLPTLRNELIASRRGTGSRRAALLRGPYEDPYDDADICARIAECFADARSLRDGSGRPLLGLAAGDENAAFERFAERLRALLGARHGIDPVLVADAPDDTP